MSFPRIDEDEDWMVPSEVWDAYVRAERRKVYKAWLKRGLQAVLGMLGMIIVGVAVAVISNWLTGQHPPATDFQEDQKQLDPR